MWDGDAQGIISAWLYSNGDRVAAGTLVAEVMVEKVSHDLIANAAGILKILVQEEEPFDRATIVGRID